ncbi:hypothetical protein RDI58_004288 [Solanum bulbocastanum]|uniref:Uncharacterized protein n=1 Tax=Solanum bulbocastanum TaxID=147425 RepID=A0AAN8YLG2_SOLBU
MEDLMALSGEYDKAPNLTWSTLSLESRGFFPIAHHAINGYTNFNTTYDIDTTLHPAFAALLKSIYSLKHGKTHRSIINHLYNNI